MPLFTLVVCGQMLVVGVQCDQMARLMFSIFGLVNNSDN